MKYLPNIHLIWLCCWAAWAGAQTPYDSFAPEMSRPILEKDSVDAWRKEQQMLREKEQTQREQEILTRLQQEPLFVAFDMPQQMCYLLDTAMQVLAYSSIPEDVQRWLSVDPLVDKNISTSPYLYCNGNPVMFIDPDGRDDYSLGIDGSISLISKTDDSYDRLLSSDESLSKNNSFIVNDKSVLPNLAANSSVEGKHGIEIADLFIFLANNTNVEWSFSGYAKEGYRRYAISTSHDEESTSPAYAAMGISERCLYFTIHSHVRENSIRGASTDASSHNQPNDMRSVIMQAYRFLEYKQKLPAHYIYHRQSGNLYFYDPWNESIFIRNLRKYSPHSGLYFLIP